jgi:GNAT superfamily N-acetyltransferase
MDIAVRPMTEGDLAHADRICRVAFGTFIGLPDPATMFGDAELVRTRYFAAPEAALVAEADGELAGSNFAANWGSFGFFGPLSIEPRLWNQQVAQRLLVATMDLFERWGCRHSGLFTFSQSPKHAGLYQKFDYWSRFLTPVMERQVAPGGATPVYARFSELRTVDKSAILEACGMTTGMIHEGLDVRQEINAVDKQRLGDTLLLLDNSRVVAFAVCHVGAGTEAGSGACYVKFGAARPGREAPANFARLLDSCEDFARSRGVSRLVAGVNTSRHEAYRTMLARGFRIGLLGVAMQRGNDPAFNRPGVYVLDDWR